MSRNYVGIEVVGGVLSVEFGAPGGPEANVPWAGAFHEDERRVSDDLLVIMPGLLTGRGLPERLATRFASMTGMDTVATRPFEVGPLTDPVRQVPERAPKVVSDVVDHVRKQRKAYGGRYNAIAQSAGQAAADRPLGEGEINIYVALSTIGLTLRDQLQISNEQREEAAALPVSERAEYLHEITDDDYGTGEQRTEALVKGFIRNCVAETKGMLIGLDGGALWHANNGGRLDVLPNLRHSQPRRERLTPAESRIFRYLQHSRFAEAFRLASAMDSWVELDNAKEQGTRVGGVFGVEDPIVPIAGARAAKPRFDDYVEVEGAGHPLMTSDRARHTDLAAAGMVVRMAAAI